MMTLPGSAPTAANYSNASAASEGPDAALAALTPAPADPAEADGALPALFAQWLNQADQTLTDASALPLDADSAEVSAAPPADAPGLPAAADSGNATSAMLPAFLNPGLLPLTPYLPAAPAPAASNGAAALTAAAPTPVSASASAASANAVGSVGSTRLNLAAASVAVLPASTTTPGDTSTLPTSNKWDASQAGFAAATLPASSPAAAAYGGGPAQRSSTATASPVLSADATPTAPSPSPRPTLPSAPAPLASAATAGVLANSMPPSAPATAPSILSSNKLGSNSRTTSDANSAGAGAGAASSALPLGSSKDEGLVASVRTPVTAAAGVTANQGQTLLPSATLIGDGAGVKLTGNPDQWQQPLREALGERLQLQLQRNDNQAVIRLDPPNMGRIEIAIRHSAGALQVSLTASNTEVVRQLNAIGDSVRQDLSQRQFSDVAVTVSTSRSSQGQADSDGRSRQQRDADDGRTPGRALSDDGTAAGSFASLTERE